MLNWVKSALLDYTQPEAGWPIPSPLEGWEMERLEK
jgi:hypothetical protein